MNFNSSAFISQPEEDYARAKMNEATIFAFIVLFIYFSIVLFVYCCCHRRHRSHVPAAAIPTSTGGASSLPPNGPTRRLTSFGGPGTITSLILRFIQLIFSGFALGLIFYNPNFILFSAFGFVIMKGMALHLVWSFVMGCYDLFILSTQRGCRPSTFVLTAIAIGDYLMEIAVLGGVSTSAGVTFFFLRDIRTCPYRHFECSRAKTSVILGFVGWVFSVISAAISYQTLRISRKRH